MSTPPARKFDFEMDYDQIRQWADHVERVIAAGKPAGTVFYWNRTGEWCQIADPFGKIIRGVDWPMELGQVYDLDQVTTPYHPCEIPCRVRVLREATHADAEAIYAGRLQRRKFYYEVITD
jgi:hypothetical protein